MTAQSVAQIDQPVPHSLDVWMQALADVPQLADRDVIADVSQSGQDSIESVAQAGNWRIEVTHKGKRYHWRTGRDKSRQHRPGGRFDQLSQERQAAYEHNKAKRHPTKSTLTTG